MFHYPKGHDRNIPTITLMTMMRIYEHHPMGHDRKIPSVYTKDHNGKCLLFAMVRISHIVCNYDDDVLLSYHQTSILCQGGHQGVLRHS